MTGKGKLNLGENCKLLQTRGFQSLGDRQWETVCSNLTRIIMSHHKRNISAIGDIFCFILKIPGSQCINSVQPVGLYKSAWLCDSAPSALNFFASLFKGMNKSGCFSGGSKDRSHCFWIIKKNKKMVVGKVLVGLFIVQCSLEPPPCN